MQNGGKIMTFKIKSRVYALGKKMQDLIPEIEARGIMTVSRAELSDALKNGGRQTPKAQQIVTLANEIVTEWERGT